MFGSFVYNPMIKVCAYQRHLTARCRGNKAGLEECLISTQGSEESDQRSKYGTNIVQFNVYNADLLQGKWKVIWPCFNFFSLRRYIALKFFQSLTLIIFLALSID